MVGLPDRRLRDGMIAFVCFLETSVDGVDAVDLVGLVKLRRRSAGKPTVASSLNRNERKKNIIQIIIIIQHTNHILLLFYYYYLFKIYYDANQQGRPMLSMLHGSGNPIENAAGNQCCAGLKEGS